jgi:hypothetical protein
VAIVKRIVCLANSRKRSGRCVAGIELVEGGRQGWIRPVSAREHEEVSENERQYEDGSDPRVGDIMDVPLLEPRPRDSQRENWLLDPELYWKRIGDVPWNELERLLDPVAPLWLDGHSTYHGLNDKIPTVLAGTIDSSLRLLRVERVTLSVFSPGEVFGNPKRRVQARFRHAGTEYGLWVTDPVYERAYLAQSDGAYQLGDCFLTVSLGEPYKDDCYKLVAAIIEPGGGART